MDNKNIAPLTFSGVLHSDGTISVPEEIADFLQEYGGEVDVTISFKKELSDAISDEEIVKISATQKLEAQHVRTMLESEGAVLADSELGRKLSELGFMGLD